MPASLRAADRGAHAGSVVDRSYRLTQVARHDACHATPNRSTDPMNIKRAGEAVLVHTPAKLNLFLHVLDRRDDGFHEIETLMRTISWRDTLSFEPTDSGQLTLDCQWAGGIEARRRSGRGDFREVYNDLPPPEENLVWRAAELIREASSTQQGARIWLRKRIPSAAGLGGASSDAAAAIAAANLAWGLNWPAERLREIATQLGSDIPFFLGEPMAICRGRGEILEPVGRDRQRYYVTVKPPLGLSTAAVYQQCSPGEQTTATPIDSESKPIRNQKSPNQKSNQLTAAAYRLSPKLKRLAEEMAQMAGAPARMSGSGTSHFVTCRNARHARRVAALAAARRLGAVCCSVT